MEDLCDFHINSFRSSVLRVVIFFYFSIYREYYALQCRNLKANIQEENTCFKISFYFDVINRHYFINGGCKHMYACMHTIYTRKEVYNGRINKINQ